VGLISILGVVISLWRSNHPTYDLQDNKKPRENSCRRNRRRNKKFEKDKYLI